MALKNNKGFSLIEIIIAIAILTLLLTPIMRQFTQTMRTSRLAKEQQYANESAVFTLEDAQMETASTLDANYGTPTTRVVTCDLVDTHGTVITSVDYTVTDYDLGEVEIGARNTKYQKNLTVDDLSTKVRGYKNASTDKGLTIDYSVADVSSLGDFEITNEGSGVHYNSEGYVDKIICKEADYVGNPNEVNLGNMQNLDKDTVAIINGDSAEYDAQADSALFSMAMDELKEIDYDSWQQAFIHVDGESVLTQGTYDIDKLTKIYVDKLNDGTKDFYRVKVDVYYSSIITVTVGETGIPIDGKLEYNVFCQDFYTAECPDIYFEYQPYITESYGDSISGYNVRYASNDYIQIDNYVPDAKLYLYKPYKDALNVANNVDISTYIQDTQTYVVENGGANVKIHLANSNSSVEDMTIYTNLNIEPDEQFKFVNSFINKNNIEVFSDITSDNSMYASSAAKSAFDSANLKALSDDVRLDSRLQSVTVTMKPVTEKVNTIRITGAKGEK